MSLALKLLNNWAFVAGLLMVAALPLYGPLLSVFESDHFPPASKLNIVDVVPNDDGVRITFTYTKNRTCEYLGSYLQKGTREIGYAPVGSDNPGTVGPGVTITRVWDIKETSLADLAIWFTYRCHPLWILATQVYP